MPISNSLGVLVAGLIGVTFGLFTPIQKTLSFDLETKQVKSTGIGYHADLRNSHLLHYNLYMSENRDRTLFLITLMFSERKVPVRVVIDTGSSVLWIFEKFCVDSLEQQFCGPKIGQISYGYLDGGISGVVIDTDVYLNDKVANKECPVMLTQSAENSIGEPILGLGPRSSEYPTFLEKLKENGLIDKRVFTIDILNKKLTFGGDKKAANLSRVPMNSASTYQITVDRISLLGKSLSVIPIDGIIDSGNTLIALPMYLKSSFITILSQSGLDCAIEPEENPRFSHMICNLTFKEIPGSLDFYIGGQKYSIEKSNLISECSLGFPRHKCLTVVEFHEFSYGVILGQPFLNQYRTTFDLDDRNITFEPASMTTPESL